MARARQVAAGSSAGAARMVYADGPNKGQPLPQAQADAYARGFSGGVFDASAPLGSERFPYGASPDAPSVPAGGFYLDLLGVVRQAPRPAPDMAVVPAGTWMLNMGGGGRADAFTPRRLRSLRRVVRRTCARCRALCRVWRRRLCRPRHCSPAGCDARRRFQNSSGLVCRRSWDPDPVIAPALSRPAPLPALHQSSPDLTRFARQPIRRSLAPSEPLAWTSPRESAPARSLTASLPIAQAVAARRSPRLIPNLARAPTGPLRATPLSPSPPASFWGDARGFGANVLRGTGLGDETFAFGAAGLDLLRRRRRFEDALTAYKDRLAQERRIEDDFRARHPLAAGAAQGLGVAATMVVPFGGELNAARVAATGGRSALLAADAARLAALRMAGRNAAKGAAGAMLYGIADRGSAEERLRAATDPANLMLGVTLGGAVPAVVQALAPRLSQLAQRAQATFRPPKAPAHNGILGDLGPELHASDLALPPPAPPREGILGDLRIEGEPRRPTPGRADSKIIWVDESVGLEGPIKTYNDAAGGVRSNSTTRSVQAPALERMMPDGRKRLVKFDGVDGDVLIDRKTGVRHTKKAKEQALRQSDVLRQHGLTGRWEVPNRIVYKDARKLLEKLDIDNITVLIVEH